MSLNRAFHHWCGRFANGRSLQFIDSILSKTSCCYYSQGTLKYGRSLATLIYSPHWISFSMTRSDEAHAQDRSGRKLGLRAIVSFRISYEVPVGPLSFLR